MVVFVKAMSGIIADPGLPLPHGSRRRLVVPQPRDWQIHRQALVSPHGTAHDVLRWSAIVALAWWGADEVVRGVNPFRRILGASVLASLIL